MAAYLARLGYSGSLMTNAEPLRGLHRAHLFRVPFENLDIHLGRKIRLNQAAFVRKVVQERRGGFCYELNGAFAALLDALRFRLTLLSARVPRDDGSDGPEFDHLTLRVDLDEPWLVDVGFGDSFVDPLRLEIGTEQQQGDRRFRILAMGDSLRLEARPETQHGEWKTEYVFGLKTRKLAEFCAMCSYHQTSRESPFTRKRVCSRATEDGRITLSGMKLITTGVGVREERELGSEAEWRAVLKEEFGVRCP